MDPPCTAPKMPDAYRLVKVDNVYVDGFAVTVACANGQPGGKAVVCDKGGDPYKLEGCGPGEPEVGPCIVPTENTEVKSDARLDTPATPT